MEQQTAELRRTILAVVDLSQYSLSWYLLFVGVATLVVVVLVNYGSRRNNNMANLPPGPRNWPVIGALLEMGPQLHKVLDRFAKRYGHVVLFRVGVETLVVVSSAEGAEELLKHRDAEFCDRACAMTKSLGKYVTFERNVFAFANFNADLKLLRKLSITEFFTTAKIRSYEELRTKEMAVMVEKIYRAIRTSDDKKDDNYSSSGSTSAPMFIRSIGFAVMRNIIFSLCIGKRFDSLPSEDELKEFPDLLDNLMEFLMVFNLVDYFPWLTWLDPQGVLKRMKIFEKRQRRFYEMILERNRRAMKQKREPGILEDADEGISGMNFVDVLLRAQETGTKISNNGIMGTILTMLAAAIDTTSAQLEWVLIELARHPEMMQRLQHEVDTVVGQQRPLEEADLTLMPFLNAVILESLRLHPAVPYSFPHVNMAPSTLGGYNIPAKTAVIMNAYSIGRDPKTWKDPLQFNPDRFMQGGSSSLSSESIKANGKYYQLLPFSSGRRACPGYNLAIVLLLRTVATLVHAFDWAPPPGCSPEDLSVEEAEPFIILPSPDLYLVPTPRLPSQVYKSNIPIT